MARSARLSTTTIKGAIYWTTKAGGKRVYFGRKDEVSRKEAERAFADHLKIIRTENSRQRDQRISQAMIVWEICDQHVLWVQKHREKPTFTQRRSICQAFCNHQITGNLYGKGQVIGDVPYDRLTLQHALDYTATIDEAATELAHVINIKACFNWAATSTEANGGGLLPENFRPFRHLKRPHVPAKDLTEADLLTEDEHKLLLKYADYDTTKVRAGTGRWRKRKQTEHRKGSYNPYVVFKDILIVMHSCGPRTSEPLLCRVRDFNRRTKQLTLGSHKRSRTQRNSTLRQMALTPEAFAIVEKHCKDKGPDHPIFANSNGRRWTQDRFNERFRELKEIIRQKYDDGEDTGFVRAEIVPYSYRDLYISELLMVGIPVFQVSKMAGTSVTMIEKVYGHFFADDLAEAQAKLLKARKSRSKKAKIIKIA